MAFDMFAGDRHESIGNHEELIFSLIAKDKSRYPELMRIHKCFYDDPPIGSSQIEQLIGELNNLYRLLSRDSSIEPLIVRLLRFFEYAKSNSLDIRTESD